MGRADYEAAFGAPYYGVHRVALLRGARRRGSRRGVVHLGRRCVGVERATRSGAEPSSRSRTGRAPSRTSSSAPTACTRSLRAAVAGDRPPVFSGTVGYRGLVPVAAMPSLPDPTPLQFWAGPRAPPPALRDRGRHDRQLPRGRRATRRGRARRGSSSARSADASPPTRAGTPPSPRWSARRDVGARWALHDLAPLERWHTGRVVLWATPPTRWCPTRARARTRRSRTPCCSRACSPARAPTRSRRRSPATRPRAARARGGSSAGRGAPPTGCTCPTARRRPAATRGCSAPARTSSGSTATTSSARRPCPRGRGTAAPTT